MNKRDFLKRLAVAAVGFTILPPATTYERIWKAARPGLIVNPEWESATYEVVWLKWHDALGSTFTRGDKVKFTRQDGNWKVVPQYL